MCVVVRVGCWLDRERELEVQNSEMVTQLAKAEQANAELEGVLDL